MSRVYAYYTAKSNTGCVRDLQSNSLDCADAMNGASAAEAVLRVLSVAPGYQLQLSVPARFWFLLRLPRKIEVPQAFGESF